ncbi:hypothetical protein H0266_02565 [Halobacillus locisalis]|uniref:Uncharacterized protein n=1 Tax=Halobacillus locisalis TaxID=220753 RepID=A0A838CPG0_9BACI|nr:hypothetical protein [Halobacillus locisalis]MBA2173773.1 hypothetical protein [Halobacillus locisalis]
MKKGNLMKQHKWKYISYVLALVLAVGSVWVYQDIQKQKNQSKDLFAKWITKEHIEYERMARHIEEMLVAGSPADMKQALESIEYNAGNRYISRNILRVTLDSNVGNFYSSPFEEIYWYFDYLRDTSDDTGLSEEEWQTVEVIHERTLVVIDIFEDMEPYVFDDGEHMNKGEVIELFEELSYRWQELSMPRELDQTYANYSSSNTNPPPARKNEEKSVLSDSELFELSEEWMRPVWGGNPNVQQIGSGNFFSATYGKYLELKADGSPYALTIAKKGGLPLRFEAHYTNPLQDLNLTKREVKGNAVDQVGKFISDTSFIPEMYIDENFKQNPQEQVVRVYEKLGGLKVPYNYIEVTYQQTSSKTVLREMDLSEWYSDHQIPDPIPSVTKREATEKVPEQLTLNGEPTLELGVRQGERILFYRIPVKGVQRVDDVFVHAQTGKYFTDQLR